MSQERSLSNFTVYPRKQSDKTSLAFFFAIMFVINMKSIECLYVGGLLPTKIYQPEKIEVINKFIISSDDTDGDTSFLKQYTLTLARLQMQNRNDYAAIASFRRMDLGLDSINFVQDITITSKNSTGFILVVNIQLIMYFSVGKFNILIISKTLAEDQLVYALFDQIQAPNYGDVICDALNTMNNCVFTRPLSVTLPSLDYTKFLTVISTMRTRNADLTLIPRYQYSFSFTTTSVSITLNMDFYQYKTFAFCLILIRNDLFQPTPTKALHFTYSSVGFIPGFFNQTKTVSHLVTDVNYYFMLMRHAGTAINYEITANVPFDNDLEWKAFGNNQNTGGFVLTFYGYVDECPNYTMALTCSTCPLYCKACDLNPTFHCTSCNTGFTLATNNQSCLCNSPLYILNDFCGIFTSGCTSVQELSNGTFKCVLCDISKKLTINSSGLCECISNFQFNSSDICQDKCGDGIRIESQCDDGNNNDGDGCSSTCSLETGFNCDVTQNPTTCKSEILLRYQVDKILKVEDQNSATMTLKLFTSSNLPYPIEKSDFDSVSSNIKLKIVISTNPDLYMEVQDLQIVSLDDSNQIFLKFTYEQTIENLQAELTLNYKDTMYKNETQLLAFSMKGDNLPLRVLDNEAHYTGMRSALLGGSIVNFAGLLVGLATPKFIGLESLLTLQIIFYSQLLIADAERWPASFTFLKYLKFVSGYNDFIFLSEVSLTSGLTKKMNILSMKKFIIENFNLNLLFLVVSFVFLVLITTVRSNKGQKVNEDFKEESRLHGQNKEQIIELAKRSISEMSKYNRANEISFWIANQISIWLILPLMAAVSTEFMIPNDEFLFINEYSASSILLRFRGVIMFLSLFIIFTVCYNNFINMWLSLSSHNDLMERPEEMNYKRLLFVYLLLIGCLIFFFNAFKLSFVYCSVFVMILHIFYMMMLFVIDPYKQSLPIHTRTLFINNGVILVFLGGINLINYVQDVDKMVFLILGYFVVGSCGLSVLLTFVRLYYELRYGKDLEDKITEEKRVEREKEELKHKMLIKNHEQRLIEERKLKESEEKKIRNQNKYLFQNQERQQNATGLLEWLQNRNWDQKAKDSYFFNEFSDKPLSWIKVHDPIKYEEKLRAQSESKDNQIEKSQLVKELAKKESLKNNPEYHKLLQKMRREIPSLKPYSLKSSNKFLQNL